MCSTRFSGGIRTLDFLEIGEIAFMLLLSDVYGVGMEQAASVKVGVFDGTVVS